MVPQRNYVNPVSGSRNAALNVDDGVSIDRAPLDLVREVKRQTSKPFAVNVTFLPSIAPPPYDEYASVIIAEGIKVVETAGGPAAGKYIKLFNSKGIYVIHKCTSIRHALSAVKMGASCLSVDGFECAGHGGEDELGGLLLLALAAKRLNIPYVASGGIGDGRGMAAALALGASGVNMGTRMMCTKESHMHENIKQAMVAGNEVRATNDLPIVLWNSLSPS